MCGSRQEAMCTGRSSLCVLWTGVPTTIVYFGMHRGSTEECVQPLRSASSEGCKAVSRASND